MTTTRMRRIGPTIAFAVLSWPGVSAADWYSIQGGPATTIRIESDGQSHQISARKVDLPVEALVLRSDTERVDYFWLEVHLPDTRDSDGYLLVIDGRSLGQIFTRGPKWAIG